MKNSELWKSYSDYTGLVSKNIRWIIGMMFGWALFKMEGGSSIKLFSLLLAILFLDFVQYFISALIIKFWTERREEENWQKHGSIEKYKNRKEIDYEKPRWIDHSAFICWILKAILFLITIICFFYMVSGNFSDPLAPSLNPAWYTISNTENKK